MWIIILGLILLSIGVVGLATAGPLAKPMKLVDYFSFCALLIGLAIFVWIAGQST